MLRDLAWLATDTVARAQFMMLHALADEIGLTQDDRRRALNLDDAGWMGWTDFLSAGPLPAEPKLSVMLQRLGEVAFNLAFLAEQRAIAA